jgi:hypothetical protein
MGTFRRVEADRAGPQALGILVPPGRRTFVILRPRALPWDLLVCRDDGAFREMSHDEASACAQALERALRGGASVEVEGTAVVRAGGLSLVACVREPGRPYAALECRAETAGDVAERLRAALCPEGEQEVYFNVRFFAPQGA